MTTDQLSLSKTLDDLMDSYGIGRRAALQRGDLSHWLLDMHYGIDAMASTEKPVLFLDELSAHYSADPLFVDIELAAQMDAAVASYKRFDGPIGFGALEDQLGLARVA